MSLDIYLLTFSKERGEAKLLAVDSKQPEQRKVLSFEAKSEEEAREFITKLNER